MPGLCGRLSTLSPQPQPQAVLQVASVPLQVLFPVPPGELLKVQLSCPSPWPGRASCSLRSGHQVCPFVLSPLFPLCQSSNPCLSPACGEGLGAHKRERRGNRLLLSLYSHHGCPSLHCPSCFYLFPRVEGEKAKTQI